MQPVGIDQRMAFGRDDFDVLHSNAPQFAGDVIRCTLDIGFVLGRGADAGNAQKVFQFTGDVVRGASYIGFMLRGSADAGYAQQVFQFIQETLLVLAGKINGWGGHGILYCCTLNAYRYTITCGR